MRTYPFLDHPGPIAFAHRGGAAEGAENSIAAFQHAVDLGYRYLETDLHATADGALVAFHDRTLDRVTDGGGRIARLTLDEVRRSRIGGREPVPLLAELLSTFPNQRFNVDVKHRGAIAPLVDLLRRTGAYDRLCVASFSDRRLATVRAALGPRVATAFGPRGIAALQAATRVGGLTRLVRADIPCVQVPMGAGRLRLVTPRFVDLAHGLGLHVHVWTIDDRAQMETLLDLGVDGIMTDRPERLRAVLAGRGLWHDLSDPRQSDAALE